MSAAAWAVLGATDWAAAGMTKPVRSMPPPTKLATTAETMENRGAWRIKAEYHSYSATPGETRVANCRALRQLCTVGCEEGSECRLAAGTRNRMIPTDVM